MNEYDKVAVVVHGLELLIDDKTVNEEHKKFLVYLKATLEE